MSFLGFLLFAALIGITIYYQKNGQKENSTNDDFLSLSLKEIEKRNKAEYKRLTEELNTCINSNYYGYLLFILQNISLWRVSKEKIANSILIHLKEKNTKVYLQYLGSDMSQEEAVKRFVNFLKSRKVSEDEVRLEFFDSRTLRQELNNGDIIYCGYELGSVYNKLIKARVEYVEQFGVLVVTHDRRPCKLFNNKDWNIIEFCYTKNRNGFWTYRPTNRADKPTIWVGTRFYFSDGIILFIRNDDGSLSESTSEMKEYRISKISERYVTYNATDNSEERTVTAVEFFRMTQEWRTFDWK